MTRPTAYTLPELGLANWQGSTIRIPELRNIPVTERVREVIDHPAFQRLRRVRMLGPSHLVYPGATHTRFEHSLGVYGCVQWYVLNLLRHPPFADSITEEDILSVLAAGLLHDIGHYPFAHTLEALHLKGRDTPRHEDVGGQIILGEIAHLRGPRPIGDLLRERWGVDPHRVIHLCTGNFPRPPSATDSILHSIISSTIDADKMDYLERDSHHMGVPYGRNYDRDRLLSNLTLNRDESKIALLSKGKISAEMFIFSRYTMYSEVYWHHTVRAASAMVESALAAFHSRSSLTDDAFLNRLLNCNDDEFLEWLREQTPPRSATHYLIDGMRPNQRSLFKRVSTFSRVYVESDKRKAFERMYNMDSVALFDLTSRLLARLSSLTGRALHPADLIIDIPPRDKDKLETIDIVFPQATGQRYYPLNQLSKVVAGIQDDFIAVVKKIRIFVEPRLARELQNHEDIDQILLLEILRK